MDTALVSSESSSASDTERFDFRLGALASFDCFCCKSFVSEDMDDGVCC